jgi:hypothetical protein
VKSTQESTITGSDRRTGRRRSASCGRKMLEAQLQAFPGKPTGG